MKERIHIGTQITLVRKVRGLTQNELGAKINLSRSAISFIEKSGKVNHYTLIAVLKALNISEEDLKAVHSKNILALDSGSPYGRTQIEKLKSKIAVQNKEIRHLRELLKSHEKMISLLSPKKK